MPGHPNSKVAITVYPHFICLLLGEHNFTWQRNFENYDYTSRNIFEACFEGVRIIDDLMDTMLHGLQVHLPLVSTRKSAKKTIQKTNQNLIQHFCQADPNKRSCRFPSYKAARSLWYLPPDGTISDPEIVLWTDACLVS